jgi:hypothetical protein
MVDDHRTDLAEQFLRGDSEAARDLIPLQARRHHLARHGLAWWVGRQDENAGARVTKTNQKEKPQRDLVWEGRVYK